MGLGKMIDSTVTGVTDFAIDRANNLQENQEKLRARFSKATTGYSRKGYRRGEMPSEVSIVDLFSGRLFSYVNFDGVLDYIRQQGWSSCENVYTIKSLSEQLVPAITYKCLTERNARGLMELCPGLIKLCIRRRKGLLVYVDIVSGKIYKIKSVKVLLEHIDLVDGVSLKDIWIPLTIALPKIKPIKINSFVTHEELEAIEPVHIQPLTPTIPEKPRTLENIQGLDEDLTDKPKTQTSIFKKEKIDTVAVFKTSYQLALERRSTESLAEEDAFDVLLHQLINAATNCAELSIKDYVALIKEYLTAAGLADFDSAVINSSGKYMKSLRVLFDHPDGSGDTNEKLFECLCKIMACEFHLAADELPIDNASSPCLDMLDYFFAKLNEKEAAEKESITESALNHARELSKEHKSDFNNIFSEPTDNGEDFI